MIPYPRLGAPKKGPYSAEHNRIANRLCKITKNGLNRVRVLTVMRHTPTRVGIEYAPPPSPPAF